ncbi:class II fructose-bisphosphatase [Desulfotomaculum defluvii]
MERELAIEIVRVTEAAAISSARWLGRGLKNEADQAATTAMRAMFDTISMNGTVVIGEGELDEAPMLYIGEKLGNAAYPEVDVAVDPLEGTTLVAKGYSNAMTVIAIANKGCLLHAPDMYMHKMTVGPRAAGRVHLDDPIEHTLKIIAEANEKNIADLTVMIQERERHQQIIQDAQNSGARVRLFSDGDVGPSIAPALAETGVDLFISIGGAPEGVITAAAMKCLGGEMQARLVPQNDQEYNRCLQMGIKDPHKLLLMEDLVRGDDAIFAATGVTEGEFLRGVRFLRDERVETDSVVMRAKTGTIRFIRAVHHIPDKINLVIS